MSGYPGIYLTLRSRGERVRQSCSVEWWIRLLIQWKINDFCSKSIQNHWILLCSRASLTYLNSALSGSLMAYSGTFQSTRSNSFISDDLGDRGNHWGHLQTPWSWWKSAKWSQSHLYSASSVVGGLDFGVLEIWMVRLWIFFMVEKLVSDKFLRDSNESISSIPPKKTPPAKKTPPPYEEHFEERGGFLSCWCYK